MEIRQGQYTSWALSLGNSAAGCGYTAHNILLYDGSGTDGSITGSCGSTAYNTSSDERLKTNMAPISAQDAGALIDALHPISWTWKGQKQQSAGFGAQTEYKDLGHYADISGAVTKGDDNPNGHPASGQPSDRNYVPATPGYQQWFRDDSKLVPFLVATVQADRKRIAALEAKVAALQGGVK
jgi:hypothetical protein